MNAAPLLEQLVHPDQLVAALVKGVEEFAKAGRELVGGAGAGVQREEQQKAVESVLVLALVV